ncbi:hypothetical protein KZZ52_41725 [Dactylosporangium sp. AC04546]|uniref:hypothetical protein n=1 Tax=Dactylosporangium sp. AC04546 TaxID=2862460 RepID=UPI001EDEFF40|nr:hypothetical protein [Dactylosporangium sp. AC04546]WVK80446.1 hypothetical protein KZZ52_41725 [Dactylosporangium sp. AC04546]
MKYLTAVQQSTELLRRPGVDDLADQVAIELFLRAWPRFATSDSGWDLAAVDLLSVRDTLYPGRLPIVLAVGGAVPDAARSAVRQLVLELAEWYERAARAEHVDHTRGRQYAAAARGVLRAAEAIP